VKTTSYDDKDIEKISDGVVKSLQLRWCASGLSHLQNMIRPMEQQVEVIQANPKQELAARIRYGSQNILVASTST